MTAVPSRTSRNPGFLSFRWAFVLGTVVILLVAATWWWLSSRADAATTAGRTASPPVSVTTARVKQQDLPVTVIANGSVVALQAVDIRAQVSSTIQSIHFTEGQAVNKGDLLFVLDARTEEANLRKAEAQVIKTRSDLANTERNLVRQRELFLQKFISQSALDTAINQADVLKGQLAVDEAAAEASRVARTLTQIRAPFAGRTGAISVRVGSLVQPNTQALVTVSQIDPIGVSFALPERELSYVQRAMAKGPLAVTIELTTPQKQTLSGKLTFIESTVDSASGTIAMKAAFANGERLLWPGSFVNVSLTARTLPGALVVPVQAVQSGPERKFVYIVGEGNKAIMTPVEVELIQSGLAAIKGANGISAGVRVVVEGAQNVRKDSTIVEAASAGTGRPTAKDTAGGNTDGVPTGTDLAKPVKK
ncbi:MAG: efflux RND transporter periplasmic adaptor subunit [Betaproteobacteria bacterium]|nr:efflux RND transporter periplasmic adaptor subunit [Betaproteobacteria bacterium]